MVGYWFKSHEVPRTIGGMPSMGVLLKYLNPYLREFRRKTTENSERLGRQALPGIESGTSRLPVTSAEPLSHWWVQWNNKTEKKVPSFTWLCDCIFTRHYFLRMNYRPRKDNIIKLTLKTFISKQFLFVLQMMKFTGQSCF